MSEHAAGTGANPATPVPWSRARTGVIAVGFALVAAFFLLREHGGHALGALPHLLLLACPLMHLFMHNKHERHRDGGSDASQHTFPRP